MIIAPPLRSPGIARLVSPFDLVSGFIPRSSRNNSTHKPPHHISVFRDPNFQIHQYQDTVELD